MKKIGTMILGTMVLALSTTACATVDRSAFVSPTMTVVAGVSMIDPTSAPAITYDAIQIEPHHAALIAAFAVAAAPQYANPIITAARNGAPERAAEIDAAAKRALRYRPGVLVRIPDHNELVRLVDRASVQQ